MHQQIAGETSEAAVDLHPATIEPYRLLAADLRAALSGDVSHPACTAASSS